MMLERVIILVVMIASFLPGHAQTFDEWFRQKKTQREYLLKRFALLKLYSNVLYKGYKISSEGLNLIKNWKDDEFKLHNIFYSSLTELNPKLKSYGRIGDCYSNLLSINKIGNDITKYLKSEKRNKDGRYNFITSAIGNLLKEANKQTKDLEDILSGNGLIGDDSFRINRINQLFEQTLNELILVRSIRDDLKISLKNREADSKENGEISGLFN